MSVALRTTCTQSRLEKSKKVSSTRVVEDFPLAGLFQCIVPLGLDKQLDVFLRNYGWSDGSLFAQADISLFNLLNFIEAGPEQKSFEFEDLNFLECGFARNKMLGPGHCCQVDPAIDNPNFRLDFYNATKRAYELKLKRFWLDLQSDQSRIFIVMLGPTKGSWLDDIRKLETQILRHRRGNRQFYILVVVKDKQYREASAAIAWITENTGLVDISLCKDDAEADSYDFWEMLLLDILNDPKITSVLSDDGYITKIEETLKPDFSQLHTVLSDTSPDALYEKCCSFASYLNTTDKALKFISDLESISKATYSRIGGDVLKYLLDDSTSLTQFNQFDEQYLRAIFFLARVNIDLALQYCKQSEGIYRDHGSSFIRYDRIQVGLTRSKSLIDKRRLQGYTDHEIIPKTAGTFVEREVGSVREAIRYMSDAEDGKKSQSIKPGIIEIDIGAGYSRTAVPGSHFDDSAKASDKWINSVTTNSVTSIRVVELPAVRVCSTPTNVYFREGKDFRYVESICDLYHYFRVTGRVLFREPLKHLPVAWVLPRFGAGNYYHSLIDKLPALYGYKLLGLDCPIISTYVLDDVEKSLLDAIGIPYENICVDLEGEYEVERGYLPDISSMRIPFIRLCSEIFKGCATDFKKLYISRSRAPQRKLINEDAVEALVTKLGFRVVNMEDYSVIEQRELAASASCIVGPHGAGLANMIFMNTGSCIVELIPEKYMTPLFKQLSIDCGHQYSVIVGRQDSKISAAIGQDLVWSVDLNRLECVLSDLEAILPQD